MPDYKASSRPSAKAARTPSFEQNQSARNKNRRTSQRLIRSPKQENNNNVTASKAAKFPTHERGLRCVNRGRRHASLSLSKQGYTMASRARREDFLHSHPIAPRPLASGRRCSPAASGLMVLFAVSCRRATPKGLSWRYRQGCDKNKTVPCPAEFTRAIMDNKELEAEARILRPTRYLFLEPKDSCLLVISLSFQ